MKKRYDLETISSKFKLLKDFDGRHVKFDVESIVTRIKKSQRKSDFFIEDEFGVCFGELSIQPFSEITKDLISVTGYRVYFTPRDSTKKYRTLKTFGIMELKKASEFFLGKLWDMYYKERYLDRRCFNSFIAESVLREVREVLIAEGCNSSVCNRRDEIFHLEFSSPIDKNVIKILKSNGWENFDKDILEKGGIKISIPLNANNVRIL